MSVYASIKLELELAAGVWTDVTADLVQVAPASASYGIQSTKVTDRVAKTGSLSLSLRNDDQNSAGLIGYYSPGHTNCRSGFKKGIRCRVSYTFDGATYVRFLGRINSIKVDSGLHGNRRTNIIILDYMDQLAKHEMDLPTLVENTRLDLVMPTLTGNLAIQPNKTNYEAGVYIFPSVFDTTRAKTTALQELTKLVTSELGYAYVRHADTVGGGEILRVENRDTRKNTTTLSDVISVTEEPADLLQENGDAILLETGDILELDNVVVSQAIFDNSTTGAQIDVSEVVNDVQTVYYPRKVDDALVTLWSLESPQSIDAGGTAVIRATYSDPNTGAKTVSGINVEIADNYAMNSASDGSGTDMTSTMIVSMVSGTNGADVTVINGGGTVGYVTTLEVKGFGIYTYDTVEVIESDETSIDLIGKNTARLELKYQTEIIPGLAADILTKVKEEKTAVTKLSFIANSSDSFMRFFLNFDIGDRIQVTDDMVDTNAVDYFINGVDWSYQNRIIYCSWSLKRADLEIEVT